MANKIIDSEHSEDPKCYHVRLKSISKENAVHLITFLSRMSGWVMLIKKRSFRIVNFIALGKINMGDVLVGKPITEMNTEFTVRSCKRPRNLVIANNSSKLFLITDRNRIALLISIIKSCIREEEDLRRQLKTIKDDCWSCLYPSGVRQNPSPASFVRRHSEFERTQSLPERPDHNTTAVPPIVDDVSQSKKASSFGQQLIPDLNFILPLQQGLFHKPLFSSHRQPEEEIKYSVQVSDTSPSVDGYRSSFERTLHSPHDLPRAEVVTNVQSVLQNIPGISDIHRTTASGYHETPSGASGNNSTHTYYQNTQPHWNTRSRASGSNGDHFNHVQNTEQQANTQRRNLKPARHPEYALDRERLQSFFIYNWDETTRPSAKDLVDSGLFATDRGDLVRCFQCGLGLKDWTKDDDPLVEHVKYSTDCDFLMQTLGVDKLIQYKDALNPSTTTDVTGNNQPPAATRNSRLPYAVRSPRYMALEDRINSFINFPPSITQSHRDLALAGLYYTGDEDICRCFTCDGGLKNWVPGDDPMEEHAKYFPQCPYLRHIKGDNFVELVRQRMQAVNVTTPSTSSGQVPVPRRMPSQGSVSPPVPAYTSRQSSQARRTDRDQDVDEILRSPVGGSILQTGYSEEVARRAIKQLLSRGIKHPSAQQTLELIFDYEENGVTPSVRENNIVNGASNETNGDEDVLTENEKLKALMKCILCKTRERNILCIPCSHHRMCQDCAREVTHCPTCGKDIEQKVKTYMS